MFDNLREKLGSFRKEAEEAAEENVEEVDEAELEEVEDAAEDEPETAGEDELGTAEETELEGVDEDDGEDTPSDEAELPESERTTPADSAAEAGPTVDGTDSLAAESEAVDADVEPADADSAEAEAVVETTSRGQESTTEGDPGVGQAEFDEAGTDEPGGADETDHDVVESAGADAEAHVEEIDEGTDTEEIGDDADGDEPDADETNATGFGRKAKSLVRGKFVIEAEDLEGPLRELELALLSSDVEMSVAEEIIETVREELVGETRTFTTSTGAVVDEALADAILEVISVGQFDFDERVAEADKPLVVVFTGVNGVGKTTSIAKLDRYFAERGYDTVMANGDTYRAGANEQLREHADARGTRLIAHEQGGDPAAVLYDAVEYAEANDVDVVLGDTAGRLHTNEGLMDQLEKIGRVVDPDMTLFVDEAVAGQDAVNRAREFDEAVEIDGTILTKADADSNGGAAISIAHVTGKPILFLGVGQGYDDLEPFDPDEMVDRLLGADET